MSPVALQSCQYFEQNLDIESLNDSNEVNNHVDDEALLIFLNHLTNIEADMKKQFTDLPSLEIPTWFLEHFEIPSDEVQGSCGLVEDLIDLRHELKPIFKNQLYQDFWLQQTVTEKYPSLWKAAKLFFIAFRLNIWWRGDSMWYLKF